MSVTATADPLVRVAGDGATVDIPFSFKLLDEAEIIVLKIDQTDFSVFTTLALGVAADEYQVAINTATEGGTVTLNAVSVVGFDYLVYRQSDRDQEFEAQNILGKLNLAQVEAQLDRVTLITQELWRRARRALEIRVTSETVDVDIEDPVARKLLVVSADATTIEMSELTYEALLAEIEAARAAAEAAAAAAASSAAAALASQTASAASAAAALASQTAAAASATAAAASAAAAAVSAAAAAASALLITPEISLVESIAAGGNITHSSRLQQHRTVQGDAAPRIASTTPFGVDPTNFTSGMEITLIGNSEADYLDIVPTDVNYGVLDRTGLMRIKRGDKYKLTWNAELVRFIGERNI